MNTSNTSNTTTFRIASMDLVDFSTKLQEAVMQGYKLDFSNENCPIQLGTLLTCCLVKDSSPAKDEGLVKEATVEAQNTAYKPSEKQGSTEVPSEEQKPSRGRKPASKVS